jgi:hypothetical protein
MCSDIVPGGIFPGYELLPSRTCSRRTQPGTRQGKLRSQFPQLNEDGDLPNTWQLVAAGWGFVLPDLASIQMDDGAGITRGIIGLVNKGQPRKPEDWGALRAWAWGAGRAHDYLETDQAVDAKHVGIDGVSPGVNVTAVTRTHPILSGSSSGSISSSATRRRNARSGIPSRF